ncbi:MAG: hypothetical protein H6728_08195 [Myxococcales bacterium]|nr:hypothetical protein [Myxococcales bacterium]MCB9643039.1 hypothetical protein [Myxococcales bacterium]
MSEKAPSLEELAKKESSPSPSGGSSEHEVVRFISHSQLFYYWPVWVTSLIFAVITRVSGKQITIGSGESKQIVYFVTSPGLGLAFLIILFAVIMFTSVNIRGVWAALVAASFVIFGLLFHFFGVWSPILKFLGGLSFYMSYHFYLVTAIVLAVVWFLVFLVYDQRHYIEFRPTQITLVEEVGEGARNFDTTGLVFDKKRDNFFQHWILGFGSGDLKITTSGGQREEIYFPNVLNISQRIEQIQRIREQRGR